MSRFVPNLLMEFLQLQTNAERKTSPSDRAEEVRHQLVSRCLVDKQAKWSRTWKNSANSGWITLPEAKMAPETSGVQHEFLLNRFPCGNLEWSFSFSVKVIWIDRVISLTYMFDSPLSPCGSVSTLPSWRIPLWEVRYRRRAFVHKSGVLSLNRCGLAILHRARDLTWRYGQQHSILN